MRSILALGLVCSACLACNSQDTSDLKRDASQLGQTAQRAAANATVAGKVETALALRKGVDVKGLHIEATGSTVTISGHVGSQAERQTVLQTANQTVGVTQVIDQMKVAPPEKSPGKS